MRRSLRATPDPTAEGRLPAVWSAVGLGPQTGERRTVMVGVVAVRAIVVGAVAAPAMVGESVPCLQGEATAGSAISGEPPTGPWGRDQSRPCWTA